MLSKLRQFFRTQHHRQTAERCLCTERVATFLSKNEALNPFSFYLELLRAMIWGINLRNVEPGNGYGGHFIKSELSEVLTSQDNLAQCLPGGSPCPDNKETSQNLIPSTSCKTDVVTLL